VATSSWLDAHGFNYSVGLGQINKSNFQKYGLTADKAFDPCRNLRASGAILEECYLRAYQAHPDEQRALRDSFSCYYSGNFTTGYTSGYVVRVVTGFAGTPARHSKAGARHVTGEPLAGDDRSATALVF
jgi:type IV secretion system protein VirB1